VRICLARAITFAAPIPSPWSGRPHVPLGAQSAGGTDGEWVQKLAGTAALTPEYRPPNRRAPLRGGRCFVEVRLTKPFWKAPRKAIEFSAVLASQLLAAQSCRRPCPSLISRLDRIGRRYGIAQIGAVLGGFQL